MLGLPAFGGAYEFGQLGTGSNNCITAMESLAHAVIIIINYLKRLAMQGWEREIGTLDPTLPTYRGKKEKGKIVEDKRGD